MYRALDTSACFQKAMQLGLSFGGDKAYVDETIASNMVTPYKDSEVVMLTRQCKNLRERKAVRQYISNFNQSFGKYRVMVENCIGDYLRWSMARGTSSRVLYTNGSSVTSAINFTRYLQNDLYIRRNMAPTVPQVLIITNSFPIILLINTSGFRFEYNFSCFLFRYNP
tara:strand:- start:157 stop:660 length:504 start_codon:yes stop_codon:yes gene_type:complete